MRTTEHAYAKVNLYLQVDAKRADGFHELQTVMHTVGLCDDLIITMSESPENDVVFHSNFAYLPNDSRNLAVRAAELFKQRVGISKRIRIDMKKRIPVSAGLAGGSSDAAAVLRACNRLLGYPLDADALGELGAQIGSDVVFCLHGGTALCRGRGEIVEPIPLERRLPFVVATAEKEHISTPTAFSLLDRVYADFDGSHLPRRDASLEGLVAALRTHDLPMLARNMHNDFESVILESCPGAAKLRLRMLELGALSSMMSGSGPSVFGIFDSYASALRAASGIGKGAFCVISVPSFEI